MALDLGGGSNILTLAVGGNIGTVSNVGTLNGSTGIDAITLGTAANNASINLAGGGDTLTFGNFANTATVSNTQNIAGGTGNDAITLSTALTTDMSVDLGTGSNTLTLAAATNTGTVSDVNTLLGGTGADTITLGSTATNASISLGAGGDTLNLRRLRQYRHGGKHPDTSPARAATTPSRWARPDQQHVGGSRRRHGNALTPGQRRPTSAPSATSTR